MLRTTNVICNIEDVPVTWVYEYYCKLSEPLVGQSINLKSFLNTKDVRPSLFLYLIGGKYVWKDFSTGNHGGHVSLVKEMFNLSIVDTIHKIKKDYSEFLKKHPNGYSYRNLVPEASYKIDHAVTRNWTDYDATYWLKFNIGSSILEKFNVKPLSTYKLVTEDNSKPEIVITKPYIYGYFTEGNTLAKIYQPYSNECKFLKIKEYIQGTDQLEFNQPNLVICSSLKDAMCLFSFGYNIEVVAPDSENAMIRPEIINIYKKKFKSICTLFDNDSPGIRAMNKYKTLYNLPTVHLVAEKDLSDTVKSYGKESTIKLLTPLLKEALKK